ncbi:MULTISPECIES: ChbG/HpnK family deacetylase [Giesbergeria]|uniref:ChbG/HpnK family deacetylase n=1 Tax=Giesbergeria sinuosa TaxID=80883 RepID=A0ABV9QCX2_9BURK
MKQITLCADDFALHPAVDSAVVALAQAGRLSATSCMTTAPRWPEAAQLLPPLRPALQVGLHFNLTEGHGHTAAPSLVQVLARAYAGQLRPAQMAPILHRQLDAFEQQLGTPPDFVDGHQHVHQLPGVRTALLQVLHARYGRNVPWVRSTLPARPELNKATLLAVLGGWSLRRSLVQWGVRHHTAFAGVYGFDAATPAAYGTRMAQWLAQATDGTLLMCHPASTPVLGDAIGAQRAVEYAYLASPEFGALLERLGVVLVQGEALVTAPRA